MSEQQYVWVVRVDEAVASVQPSEGSAIEVAEQIEEDWRYAGAHIYIERDRAEDYELD